MLPKVLLNALVLWYGYHVRLSVGARLARPVDF